MAVPLEIQIKTLKPHLATNEETELIIDVTAKGINIENANITVTTTGGVLSESSGVTDVNGVFKTIFSPGGDGIGDYTVTFQASKSPLTTATESTKVTVEAPKSEYTERHSEILIGVRLIRQRILEAIKEELNNDPDLYPSTGASRPPIYLNGFNYRAKDFPQVIVSSGTLAPRRVSIGDNIVGWVHTEDGQQFKDRGGIHDLTVVLATVAEDKQTQEFLLDKCTMVLWQKKLLAFLAAEIWILSVNAGGETTQPWGSKLLYAGSVTINLATQWNIRDVYNQEISQLNYDQQVG